MTAKNLLEPLPLPHGLDEIRFEFDPMEGGQAYERVVLRSGDQFAHDRYSIADCKSVVYVRDPEARGFLAFLIKKPVLVLDPEKVAAKRKLVVWSLVRHAGLNPTGAEG